MWEDFIDILYAPSQVFARRARGSFWIPFFVVTFAIGGLGSTAVTVPLATCNDRPSTARTGGSDRRR